MDALCATCLYWAFAPAQHGLLFFSSLRGQLKGLGTGYVSPFSPMLTPDNYGLLLYLPKETSCSLGEQGRARHRCRAVPREGAGGRGAADAVLGSPGPAALPPLRCAPVAAPGAGGSSPVPRGLQLPALRGAARRRPRRRERLSREPSSPSGRSMNGSVAGGGYAEEIISLTRRPSGTARAASPLHVRDASRAGAAAPRPAQPPERPERKHGVAAAGGAAVEGTGAAEGGSRRRG